jgi:photosystem II stability/assembly factor-like uncharacterized protein
VAGGAGQTSEWSIPATTLVPTSDGGRTLVGAAPPLSPLSVSFASATRGWLVGADTAGRAVILATADGGRSWHSQLRS